MAWSSLSRLTCARFCPSQENVNSLLPVFEEFLKDAPNDASYDAVRQSVVVLMGSLAKHLDKSDPKVKPIVAKLIAALSTPSQQVPFIGDPWVIAGGRPSWVGCSVLAAE